MFVGGGGGSVSISISVLLRKSKMLYVMDFIELNDIRLGQIASEIRDGIALFREGPRLPERGDPLHSLALKEISVFSISTLTLFIRYNHY